MGVQRVLGCLHNSRVVRQSQVVVGAEVEHALSICIDFHVLRTGDDTLDFEGSFVFHVLQLRVAHLLQHAYGSEEAKVLKV